MSFYVIKDDGHQPRHSERFRRFTCSFVSLKDQKVHFGRQETTVEEGLYARVGLFFQANARIYVHAYFLPSLNCQTIVKTFILLSHFCLYDSLNLSNHCRSIFLRRSLWQIQDHLSHTKSHMIAQSSSFM